MCGCVLSSAAVIAVAAGIGVAVAAAGVRTTGIGAAAVAAGIAAAAAGVGTTAGITAVIAAAFFAAACGAVCVTETAAGAGLCRRREQIQRERYPVEVAARIYISICGNAARFGYAVAKAVYQHIYGTEQFDDGKQTQCDINGNGCAHGCVAIVTAAVAASTVVGTAAAASAIIASAVIAAVAAASTARVFQFCCQTNGFPFCCYERTAMGIAAAVKQIGYCGDVGFCGTKQCYFQCVGAGSICAADGAAVSSAEFQRVVKHIPQFQIPAAFPESVGAFAQNVDSAQFRIVHGNSCCIDRGNDDVAIAHHVVAAIHAAANASGRTQNVRTQTFLDSALVKDFLCDDAGFVLVVAAVAATASCSDFCIVFKFKSSHKTASFGYCDWILLYTMWLCEMGAFNRNKKCVVEKHLYLCDGFGEFFCKKDVIIIMSSWKKELYI